MLRSGATNSYNTIQARKDKTLPSFLESGVLIKYLSKSLGDCTFQQ